MEENKNNILVVLCAGEPIDGCQFLEVEYNKIYDSKIYIGGEARMKSAVKLLKNAEWKYVILVGGSEEKVSCMKKYILERVEPEEKEGEKLENRIIRIESDPDTNGNLNAVKKALDGLSEYKNRLYFLTNRYHIKRVKLFVKEIFEKDFENDKFLEAEDSANQDNIINLIEILGLRERIEQQGCLDWKNRIYRNQHKELHKFKCVVHDISPYKRLMGM